MDDSVGKVFLVGAGPGAPDLITLRGAECLKRADAVIYDYLANPALLKLAPPEAELIFVGKQGDGPRGAGQDEINRMLIDRARRGQTVVRLKGGDPFIFGRGGEEAESLAKAAVPFEVVPGVTSAIAAPAFAGIPLTHRGRSSFVTFVTGHEDSAREQRTSIPWQQLAAAAREGGTLVLLMAAANLKQQLTRLERGGLPGKTPAAAVQWGSTASQRTVSGTVRTLAAECARARLGTPAVVVVGECAALRTSLQWFEKLPLFGRRIVVTRPRAATEDFAQRLRELGADAIEFPTIEVQPPASYVAIDNAIAQLQTFDWIIFTSANAVDAFVARVRELGHDIRELGPARICAIGPATAERVASHALRVAAVPAEFRAEQIVEVIGERRIRGAQILIPRAQVARGVLPELLLKKGARTVEVAPVYRTVKPRHADSGRVRELAEGGLLDLVVFTSSSTVSNFAEMVGRAARGLNAAVIGPLTAETAADCGFKVVLQPEQYTAPALLDAIREYYHAGGKRSRPRASTRRAS
ncbi:MAG TPA: uroporphyrinogen-III C-methyltransferase [Candidatus Binataceae bacterium]|nr:uroporphyrinogen-III C-methyltransferase [Candidatus Binataceae bacterium]